jgi:hypothetical protein
VGQGRLILALALAVSVALAMSLTAAASAEAKAVWLCKPGAKDNPCDAGLKTSVLSPDGQILDVEKVEARKRPKIDCFYVYPTVSDQDTVNADLSIDPELRSIALYQAARYSTECRVFAPVYRQITLAGLGSGNFGGDAFELAYSDVLAAWNTYLRKHNHGRGVVLIGHSQGAIMLNRLAQEEIDPNRKKRRKLVSALLLGGNVTVGEGGGAGGAFENIPACRSKRHLGCAAGFSTFNDEIPKGAVFGRAGSGEDVLCVNPAKPGGGAKKLRTIYPSEPFAPGSTIAAGIAFAVPTPPPPVSTPWIEYRGAYNGQCSSDDDADVLQITPAPGAPKLNASPSASWGLHLVDANIALGDLIALVHKQAKKFVNKNR